MKTVFLDVDTQLDFLYPAGALYVPGAEHIVRNIAFLNRHAAKAGCPVISTVDAHSDDDPEFRTWSPHCIAGTAGQQKPGSTLLEKRIVIPNRHGAIALNGAQQIILEKQTLNCFAAVNTHELLRQLGAQRYVVYGVVTEVCVKFAAMGLLESAARVEVVTDAICHLNDLERDMFLAEFSARGGVITTVAKITA